MQAGYGRRFISAALYIADHSQSKVDGSDLSSFIHHTKILFLLLVLHDIVQAANMRQDLHHELITIMQNLLGIPNEAHTSRSDCNDNCALGQRGTLRQEADNLLDREDEVAASIVYQYPTQTRKG